MTATATHTATRQDLSNGRYRYEIDGKLFLKASKVRYEAFTLWQTSTAYAAVGHKSAERAHAVRTCPSNKYLTVKLATVVVTEAGA